MDMLSQNSVEEIVRLLSNPVELQARAQRIMAFLEQAVPGDASGVNERGGERQTGRMLAAAGINKMEIETRPSRPSSLVTWSQTPSVGSGRS